MARRLGIFGIVLATLFLGGMAPALAQQSSLASPPTAVEIATFSEGRDDRSRVRQVTNAIRQASRRTGVDYHYLVAKAQLESGLNPNAKARQSSAVGLFQFIEGTWLSSFEKNARRLGIEPTEGNAPSQTRIRSEAMSRQALLELRKDPEIASLIAAAHAQDNADTLLRALGRSVTNTELYLAHFLGSSGAVRFLRQWQSDPTRSAAALFPDAARANRGIFFSRHGQPRSLEAVRTHIEAKMMGAIRLAEEISGASAYDPSSSLLSIIRPLPVASYRATQRGDPSAPRALACNHILMCYERGMNTSIITRVRDLVESGEMTRAGLARAAGLHANTLRDAGEADWNPTAETLAKLEAFLDSNDERPVLVGIEEIIDEARNGRMYILVDDEDRENEGDLIIPAQMATPAAINFMATHGRGLICLALDRARVDALGLEPMSRNNKESMQTAFTISIEAKEGVTTGISAADRARTVSVAIDASKGEDDIVTPGHVFPLAARDGGTLVRAGHTEAAVDISRLAGLNPSGVICEIMNDDGSMARLDDLVAFARKHDLKIGTIRDLIAYRMRNDHLVERLGERSFESDYGGQWRLVTYRDKISNNEAYVLQKGHVSPEQPTLARVHPISVFDDVLGAPGPRKRTLQRAMGAIGEHGSGVIVILTQRVGSSGEWSQDEEIRNIGIGSQILADLGVHDMVLLSNSRPDLVALEGFGISITDFKPIPE